jgi:hypothetical protein
MREASRALALVVFQVLVLALIIRVPLVLFTSRYFYHEDDAHHFNRTVEMAKRRDLNPHYFNKPSLHFYLRLPVVAASVAVEKARGHMDSVDEVRTRDPYGLAGYAYTASHPPILAWNRSFSVALSLGIIALSLLIAFHLRAGRLGIFLTGAIAAFSPEFLANSHIIGVDIVMAFFCILCTATAMSAARAYSRTKLILSCLLAGLAGASKYNALPIAFVPLMTWYLRDRSLKGLAFCGIFPLLGFLIGCPYALVSFSEFWTGLSYEVWHYSVAGHEGHSAKPGIEQARFYLTWLITDGVGISGAILAALGATTLIFSRSPQGLAFLTFPALYIVLMVCQKANFTRNMVPIVPYVAICAGLGLNAIFHFFYQPKRGKDRVRQLVVSLIIIGLFAATLTPLIQRSAEIVESSVATDSRETLADWAKDVRPPEADLAIAGPLQAPPSLFKVAGVDAFDPLKQSLASLAQSGYEYIATPSAQFSASQSDLLEPVITIAGESSPQRVPHSPAITILKVNDDLLDKIAELAPTTIDLIIDREGSALPCTNAREGHCWIQNRITTVVIHAAPSTPNTAVRLEVMTPWKGQKIALTTKDGRTLASLTLENGGVWTPLTLSIPRDASPLVLTVSQVHSPHSKLVGGDKRRLGIALRIAS